MQILGIVYCWKLNYQLLTGPTLRSGPQQTLGQDYPLSLSKLFQGFWIRLV